MIEMYENNTDMKVYPPINMNVHCSIMRSSAINIYHTCLYDVVVGMLKGNL